MESIRVSGIIPASPERVFDAWMNAEEHSRFTGGKASIDPDVGGSFSAWDGYISGRTLALETGKRIVQAWRSTDFEDDDPDSRLEVVLDRRADGSTEITFLHSGLPDGQGSQYEMGWVDNYLTPMRRFFAADAEKQKAAAAKFAKAAQKADKAGAAPAKGAESKPNATGAKSAGPGKTDGAKKAASIAPATKAAAATKVESKAKAVSGATAKGKTAATKAAPAPKKAQATKAAPAKAAPKKAPPAKAPAKKAAPAPKKAPAKKASATKTQAKPKARR